MSEELKERAKAAGEQVLGKAQQAAGDLTDNERLEAEGKANEAQGKLRDAKEDALDKAEDAVDKTIDRLR